MSEALNPESLRTGDRHAGNRPHFDAESIDMAEGGPSAIGHPAIPSAFSGGPDTWHTLLSLLPAGVYACDAQGRVMFFNRRAAELLGREPGPNDSHWDFGVQFKLHQPDGTLIPRHRTPMGLALTEGRSCRDREIIMERPDGSRFIASMNVDAIRDATGKLTGVINVFEDITERKLAESALRESEERFSRFMQHLPGLAWIKDCDGRYVFANDAAERAFRTDRAILYGKRDEEIFPAPTAEQFRRNDQTALEQRTGVETIETLEHEDGVHHSLVSKFPIAGPDGTPRWVGGMAIDITERTKVEQALRASEERFRTLASYAPVGIFMTDAHGGTEFVNESWCRMTGLSSEAARGTGWTSAIHQADRERIVTGWNAAAQACVPSEAEFRFVRPDGTVTWVHGNAVPLRNAAGELAGYIGTITDITERKLAEVALRDSEERKAAILESALDCLITMDHEGRVVDFNPAAERTFGYPRDAAVGRTVADLIIPPRMRQAHWDGLQRFLTTGEHAVLGKRIEIPAMRADGTEIDVELAISTVRLGGGPPFFTAYVRDITERKRAEQALAESEAKFRDMADNISQLAWMADGEGWVFWYNRRWFEYTGTTLEQMQGWGWMSVHHPDHVERVVEKVSWHWKSGKVWEDTFPLRGADGKYRWFLSCAQPIWDESGNIVRWFGTNTDITEQLAAEEALREADRRKDEFLATLAHELRNPLAPICNGLELMRVAGNDAELVGEIQATMERQTRHLVRLVDDLLDISRITRGRVELRKSRVELQSVIESAVEASRPLVEEWEHRLELRLPTQPIVLEVDATRLAQVFSNLLNNAAKYMRPGGQITLSAERCDNEAVVSVRDSGIGIPQEMLNRIFDLFTQVDRSLERSHSGLGIGLTLVKRLVEMHGGSVEARSAGPDLGSEFIVRLPLIRGEAEKRRDDPSGAVAASSRLHLLVVDDNDSAAAMLTKLLEALGNEVRSATNGVEAVQIAASFRPDLIFLDIGMPGLNGYDTARQIRAEEWGRETTLVALTGWGQEEDKRRSHEAGFDHHFVKPITPEALRQLLTEGRRKRG